MSAPKKSAKPGTEASYKVNDIVLAKLKGYPPWPGMIVDPDSVSKQVKREKPPSKKTTFYCVRFFPAGDHSWAVAKDISRLLPHEIEAYINEPSKKSGELKRGYEVALNPKDWEEAKKKEHEEYERAMEEQEESVDQLESDVGEDELEGEEGDDSEEKKKKKEAKKRKRESLSADDKKKKRKSASEALASTRRPIAGGKKKSKKALSSENVESEDDKEGSKNEGDEPVAGEGRSKGSASKSRARKDKESKPTSSERPSKRAKKEKVHVEDADEGEDALLASDPEAQRVKEWRHKLQRAFLTAKSPPLSEDMPTYDQIFSTVEDYKGLNIQYLSFSKIGKVMRRIASMDDIPRNDEFHFKERATALVTTWQAIIAREGNDKDKPSTTEEDKENAPEEKPAAEVETNGMDIEVPVKPTSINGHKPSDTPIEPPVETKTEVTINGIKEDAPAQNGVAAEGEDNMDTSDS